MLLLGIWAMLASGEAAHATDYVWTGAVSTNWFTADNWLPNGVPGFKDTAAIAADQTVDASANVSVAGLTLAAKSTLQGTGKVTVTSSALITDAMLSGSGALEIAPGAVLNFNTIGTRNGLISGLLGTLLDTVLNILIDKPIKNLGTVNLNGGNLKFGSTFENLPGSTFNLNCDSVLTSTSLLPPAFINNGTLQKAAGAGTSVINLPFTNKGIMRLQSGILSFKNGFTQTAGSTNLNGGQLQSAQTLKFEGGRLTGIGIINGSASNSGAVVTPGYSPGTITINGNYTQTSNGTLEMELGGTSPGNGYDQMVVNGNVSLAGTLDIVQYNNYVPAADASFQLMRFYSCSGSFNCINNRYPAAQRYFITNKTTTYYIATAKSDTTAPTVAVNTPAVNAAATSLSSATGSAGDVGSGLANVAVRLYRLGSANVSAGYWNGSTWDASYNAALHERLATGTSSWSFALPNLTPAQYSLRATAKDKANASAFIERTFWIDNTAPASISFVTPTANATISNLNTISVAASDGAGSGISKVELQIKRSDNLYWTGSKWASGATNLATALSGSYWTRANSNATPMPTSANLPGGLYSLTATATDRAGLRKTITISVTVSATTSTKSLSRAVTTTQSTLDLSGAIVSTAESSLQLVFCGALDIERASNSHNYLVLVNGRTVMVESVFANVDATTITLVLPEGSLRQGVPVTVLWSDLWDAQGHMVAGEVTLAVP